MSFRFENRTLNYWYNNGIKKVELLMTNNVGTRDQHLQTIIDQLIEMNRFLLARLYCIAENVYLPIGVDMR